MDVRARGSVGSHIHPSEPSYIWMEGGTNYGIYDDNTPYTARRDEKREGR